MRTVFHQHAEIERFAATQPRDVTGATTDSREDPGGLLRKSHAQFPKRVGQLPRQCTNRGCRAVSFYCHEDIVTHEGEAVRFTLA